MKYLHEYFSEQQMEIITKYLSGSAFDYLLSQPLCSSIWEANSVEEINAYREHYLKDGAIYEHLNASDSDARGKLAIEIESWNIDSLVEQIALARTEEIKDYQYEYIAHLRIVQYPVKDSINIDILKQQVGNEKNRFVVDCIYNVASFENRHDLAKILAKNEIIKNYGVRKIHISSMIGRFPKVQFRKQFEIVDFMDCDIISTF